MNSLFEIDKEQEKFDPNFLFLAQSNSHKSARESINEIFNSWNGFDHHFKQEFQTSNFNSRLWEIFLYATFKSLGFGVTRCPEGRPDFQLEKDGNIVFVEAVTSNPRDEEGTQLTLATFDTEPLEKTFTKIRSALTSKLNKKYWDLPWVKGNAFVIAISPFHSSEALNTVDFDMIKYLYGSTIDKTFNKDGNVVVNESKTSKIEFESKSFSVFFDLPRASEVSGVLFCNTGTIGKFSRMGFQRGYGVKENSAFFYSGSCWNEDPKSLGIRQFYVQIKPGSDSDREFVDEWRFGLSLFHNHNATNPLGFDFFSEITQGRYSQEEGFMRKMLSFHPYNAKNLRISPLTKSELKANKKLREGFRKSKSKM